MMAERPATLGGAGGAGAMQLGIGFGQGGAADLGFIINFVLFVIFVLTIASATATKFAAGGGSYTLFYYLAVMFCLSAIVIFTVPVMVDMALAPILE